MYLKSSIVYCSGLDNQVAGDLFSHNAMTIKGDQGEVVLKCFSSVGETSQSAAADYLYCGEHTTLARSLDEKSERGGLLKAIVGRTNKFMHLPHGTRLAEEAPAHRSSQHLSPVPSETQSKIKCLSNIRVSCKR